MHLNNIFGEIQEDHVTFVIDTSCEMREMLSIVKNHLNDVLLELSSTRPALRFNIVQCGTEVRDKFYLQLAIIVTYINYLCDETMKYLM